MSKQADKRARAERAAALLAAQRRRERMRNILTGVAVIAVMAVLVGVGFWINSTKDTTGDKAVAPRNLTGPYSLMVGDASAPTTVTLYEDLQCPVCQSLESNLGQSLQQAVEDGKIKLDYHMVSILDHSSTTDYSSRALNALAAVLDTSGPAAFVKYHEILFAQQPQEGTAGLTDADLIRLAGEAGVNESEVRGPINDDKFHQWVVNATDEFSRKGLNSTPTAFIDGKSAGNGLGEIIVNLQKVLG